MNTVASRRVALASACNRALLLLDLRSIRFLRRALSGEQLLSLATPSLVPLARDLRRQLPISQAECERHRERNRAEKNRERCRDDIRRDAELLERHEDGKQNDPAPPSSG